MRKVFEEAVDAERVRVVVQLVDEKDMIRRVRAVRKAASPNGPFARSYAMTRCKNGRSQKTSVDRFE